MFMYFVSEYGPTIMMGLLCAIFGCLGYAAKQIVAKYLTDDAKLAVARTVVQFVEQVYKQLHGPEKLAQALNAARAMLEKKGIGFDAEEMQVLIEAALAEFNEAFRRPLEDSGMESAVRRVESVEAEEAPCGIPMD